MTGHYRPDHVFVQIAECDNEVEGVFKELNIASQEPAENLPRLRYWINKGEPNFDVRTKLYESVLRDLTQIHGMGGATVLTLLAECGDDMAKWATAKRFTSWARVRATVWV